MSKSPDSKSNPDKPSKLSNFHRFVNPPHEKNNPSKLSPKFSQTDFLNALLVTKNSHIKGSQASDVDPTNIDQHLINRLATEKFSNVKVNTVKDVTNTLRVPITALFKSPDVEYMYSRISPLLTLSNHELPTRQAGLLDMVLRIGDNISWFRFIYYVGNRIKQQSYYQVYVALLQDVNPKTIHFNLRRKEQTPLQEIDVIDESEREKKVQVRMFQSSDEVLDIFPDSTHGTVITEIEKSLKENDIIKTEDEFQLLWFTKIQKSVYNTITLNPASSTTTSFKNIAPTMDAFMQNIVELANQCDDNFKS